MSREWDELLACIKVATESGVLRKLILSKPSEHAPAPKQEGKVCLHRGGRVLVLEAKFEGGRVAQKLYTLADMDTVLISLLSLYGQINLLTSAGDAELRTSKKGKTALLGAGSLLRKLGGEEALVRYDLPIDREKKYILTGEEPFLHALGISDARGRVHDKRQAKFRQINHFLSYVEGVYHELPKEGTLTVFDLCCGKSYLSFALYYYLVYKKNRTVCMTGVDLKQDVMTDCTAIAAACGFSDMHFICGDVRRAVPPGTPDMVISLHACDIATDIVLEVATARQAKVILSTPCCHRYVRTKIDCPPLSFVTRYPQLSGKLCEALTDALRLARLEALGYTVTATELTDPENTPKNTLLRAIRRERFDPASDEAKDKQETYRALCRYILNDAPAYPEEV